MTNSFKEDVLQGLSAKPKYLSSKYFYDKKGDALFQQIMKMPEYYLTDCEMEIFREQKEKITESLDLDKKEAFDLIELGAGDGTKTVHLLRYLTINNYNFEFIPIDISKNALLKLESFLKNELNGIQVNLQPGEYFKVLKSLMFDNKPKVILFIGSNIGNLSDKDANKFLKELSSKLSQGDKLLLGVDMIKSKEIVLPAYNDKAGITKSFNLNLLERINRELGADFNIDHFEHCPEYSEETGITNSFLKSRVKQEIYIEALDQCFTFEENEMLQTEMSRKYNEGILEKIIEGSNFTLINKFTDSKNYFADYLFVKE